MPRPHLFPRKDPIPVVQEAGWASGPVWTGAENLVPTGIRFLDRPSRRQSLYQLRYPAHKIVIIVIIIGPRLSTDIFFSRVTSYEAQSLHLVITETRHWVHSKSFRFCRICERFLPVRLWDFEAIYSFGFIVHKRPIWNRLVFYCFISIYCIQ
jgi:hypothetical protein